MTDAEKRFNDLIGAYGAHPSHWPIAERDWMEQMATTPAARALLMREAALDDMLSRHFVRHPGAALVRRIALGAPTPARLWQRATLWWSGLAVTGVGSVGILLGGILLPVAVPAAADSGSYALGYALADEEPLR